MEDTRSILLSNGAKMPMVGLGTYSIKTKEPYIEAIVKHGYRFIDTASYYENETFIGEAINEVFATTEIKREDLFIITKLWTTEFDDPEAALKRCLARLNTPYVDVYLIHWPTAFYHSDKPKPMHVLWKELEALVDAGLTKAIGISNFNLLITADLLTYARHKPVLN